MVVSISSCPTEIIQMIAVAADPTDLANLRLVSKQWCAVSSRLFGLANLRHPRFIISPYSLQGLVDLTAHPIFGPCVESVNIGSYRLKKHLVNTQPHLDINHANAAALKQFRFEQTGSHLNLLAQAFANLRDHGVMPMLGAFEDIVHLAPDNEVVRRGYGYDELYGPIDVLKCGNTQVAQTLVSLIEASLNSDHAPGGVSVDVKWDPNDREAVSLHSGLYSLLYNLSIQNCGCLKSPKDLTVTLTSGKDKIRNKHHLEIRNKNSHLRLIRVSIEEYEDSIFPQLEPGIFDCEIDRSVFGLLKTHARSLRHLTLHQIVFHDYEPDDAVDLFLVLRDDLAFALEMFREDHGYQPFFGCGQVVALLSGLIRWVQIQNTKLRRFEDDEVHEHNGHDDGNDDGEHDDYEYEGEDEWEDEGASGDDDRDHRDYEQSND
ncbi:MAG: SWIB-domain-containing protein [Aureobasidium pullulans]|nr:MAG: SWIB-domain-containing protein [Aureobasidium pullulans]